MGKLPVSFQLVRSKEDLQEVDQDGGAHGSWH